MKPSCPLVVLAVAALAGCGGGSGAQTGNTLHVSETEFKLDPARLTLDDAGSYTLHAVNDGSVDHALEIEGPGVEQETATLAPGDSADLAVTLKKGRYELYCPIGNHRQQGMEATLVVAGGGAGGGTTTDEDEDGGYGY